MRSRELEQANNTALHSKTQLKALRKYVEENGPSTYSQIALIEIIDSLADAVRQICMVGDRSANTY